MTLSIAASSDGWRDFCEEPDRLDAGLRTSLDAGAPIVLTSRFSTPTGENARTSAINSLYEATRVLARQSGIDVEPALPSREDLDVRLLNAPATRSKRLQDGKDILHRFVTLDLRPAAPVVILVATGTGRIAAKGFIQPFTHRAAELVWEHEAALLATKRWDRANRNDDLVGPLFMSMSEYRTWVCTDRLFREMNDETRLFLMVESFAARSNTGGEDHAKRLGQADHTGRSLTEGQVAYHLPSAPPPGMGFATLKRRPNVATEKVAYLDTAGCRPHPGRAADGLSDVRNDDGQVVDQVDNVRFFLTHYGRPEWMDGDRLLREMSRRRFSTVHLRGMYGADAYLTTSRGYTAIRTILDNLDVYETGVLRREAGGQVPTVEIGGVVPPDGPWASAEDFARVRGQLARGKDRAGRKVSLPLSGLRTRYDGVPCRTRSVASRSTRHANDPCLAFQRVREDGREVRVNQHVLLPWPALAESIADAIIAAGTDALAPLAEQAGSALEAAQEGPSHRLAELDEALQQLQRRRDGLVAQLGELDADGRPVLRGAFLKAAQEQHEDLDSQQIPDLERQRDELDAQQRAASRAPEVGSADPGLLPHLLASLRDPSEMTYAAMWKRIIHSLTFTSEPSSHHAKTSRLLRWRGAIRLDGGVHGTVVIPFEGDYEYRRVKAVRRQRHVERQHEYLAAMLQGVPFTSIDLPARKANQPRVARLLDIAPEHPLFHCDDSRIVAAATGLLHRGSANEAAELGGAGEGFLGAVHRVHVGDRSGRPWRTRISPQQAAFYELAADDGMVTTDELIRYCNTTRSTVHTVFGTLKRHDPNWQSRRKRGYQLAPCDRCGNHDRRPAEVAEIEGLLCRQCEHDQAGVFWPLESYEPYLARSARG